MYYSNSFNMQNERSFRSVRKMNSSLNVHYFELDVREKRELVPGIELSLREKRSLGTSIDPFTR